MEHRKIPNNDFFAQRVPTSLKAEFRAAAKGRNVSVSEAFRFVLLQYVENFNSQSKNPAA